MNTLNLTTLTPDQKKQIEGRTFALKTIDGFPGGKLTGNSRKAHIAAIAKAVQDKRTLENDVTRIHYRNPSDKRWIFATASIRNAGSITFTVSTY